MQLPVSPKPRVSSSSGRNKITIVASQFNAEYADGLVEAAIEELASIIPGARVDLIRVPGAYEIPLAAKLILKNEAPAAVICLGLILQGATAHAQLIATSITDQLLSLSLDYETIVINEVLLVANREQASERCLGVEKNRGVDAARAAAGMLDVIKELNRTSRSR